MAENKRVGPATEPAANAINGFISTMKGAPSIKDTGKRIAKSISNPFNIREKLDKAATPDQGDNVYIEHK